MAQWTRYVCCQAWQPESDPWDLCDSENPHKLTSELHTHTMVHVHLPPPTLHPIYTNKTEGWEARIAQSPVWPGHS